MKTKLHFPILLILLYAPIGCCKSDVLLVGYTVSLAVPSEYSAGFIGRAYLMETDHRSSSTAPGFRAALSVESGNDDDGKYSCSLQVLLGDVKVWNSGHYSTFLISESDQCLLELTLDGDLRLKAGPNHQIGWRTGTTAQSVQRLQILRNGNLVLVDALNLIKWQSFNFPTDVMLWGQRLDVATRLTSFPLSNNSSSSSTAAYYYYYSLEIQHDKIALYLNSHNSKYSYWEFAPSNNRTINFMQLGSQGLELFNDRHRKIAQIFSFQPPPRFLALNNRTGNMALFHYFPHSAKFEPTFQALNSTCDLPLACNSYGVCTFSNSCSCIHIAAVSHKHHPRISLASSDLAGCAQSGDFCGIGSASVKMVELEGVSSVLRDGAKRGNLSRVECIRICIEDCKCVAAAFYSSTSMNGSHQCYIYQLMVGIKQVGEGAAALMVKVPKGSRLGRGKSNPKKWVLLLVGVVDGLIILLVFGGLIYYLIWKRKRSSDSTNNR